MTDKIIPIAETYTYFDDKDAGAFYTITGTEHTGYMVVRTSLWQSYYGGIYARQHVLTDEKNPMKRGHVFENLERAKKAIFDKKGMRGEFGACAIDNSP